MKRTDLMELVDEVIVEELGIIEEFFKEEIQPIIDYKLELEKKQFEREYKEVKTLEKEV